MDIPWSETNFAGLIKISLEKEPKVSSLIPGK